jgi:outer membrane protein OmpA-like peptidoglycan-associated protein
MILSRTLILIAFLMAEFAFLTLDPLPFSAPDSPARHADPLPVLAKNASVKRFAATFEAGAPTAPQGSILQSNSTTDRHAVKPETHAFVVLFDFDSNRLTGAAQEALNAAVDIARHGRQIRIFAAGHADKSGSSAYNLALSHQRVDAVRKAFLERGIPSEQIDIEAFGENRPRVVTADGSPDSRNRRVEIIVGPAPNI